MTSDVTDALKHLTTTFTVKDIMTAKSRLVCATDAEGAPAISATHPDFSVIPITKDGEFTAYFERDAKRVRPIEVGDLVSEGTTLLKCDGHPAGAGLLLRPDSPTYRRLRSLLRPEPPDGEVDVLRHARSG